MMSGLGSTYTFAEFGGEEMLEFWVLKIRIKHYSTHKTSNLQRKTKKKKQKRNAS